DALELPGMRGAVIPLVRAGHAVIHEFVADRLPRLSPVVRALHDLSVPAARLGRVQPVRVGGRSLHVINLPSPEVPAAHLPMFPFAIGGENEGAFTRAHQNSYVAHSVILSMPPPRQRPVVPHCIVEPAGPETTKDGKIF